MWESGFAHYVSHQKLSYGSHLYDYCDWYVVFLFNLFIENQKNLSIFLHDLKSGCL